MRSLRLVVSCTLLAVALTIAPASGASGDEPDGGGLLGKLAKNLTGSTAPPTSQKSTPSPEPEQPESAAEQSESTSKSARSSADAATTESDSNDVSASAPGDPAQDDTYTVAQDSGATVLTPDINANDTETPFLVNLSSDPPHGTYDAFAGTYTPDPGYSGTDTFTYSFVYRTATGTSSSNTATVTITVTPKPVTAVDDTYTVAQDSGATVLTPDINANDTETPFLVNLSSDPPHGTYDAFAGTYTPDPGYSGTDTFTYSFVYRTATGTSSSNTATVTITVKSTSGPAVDDDYTVPADESTQLNPDVTANDDISSDDGLDFEIVEKPAHGTVTPATPGGHDYVYTPDPDYTGPDSFKYSIVNPGVITESTATVTLTVVGPDGRGEGEDDLLDIETNCSGDIWFTNTSDIGLEVVYGDLPSDVDGDFVIAPGDTEEVSTDREALEYRADGPGDETQEGTVRFYCSGDDDDDDDDDGDDDDGDGDDGDDGDDDEGGDLPDTGGSLNAKLLFLAMLSSIGGLFLIARTRRVA